LKKGLIFASQNAVGCLLVAFSISGHIILSNGKNQSVVSTWDNRNKINLD